ncbi:hypothetical protein [Latilactobacillus curvatus]|uniref:hypothetical protein n=1 Tax=Latilactobacillus curvatus TaxID=28038 RepID=UPI003888D363
MSVFNQMKHYLAVQRRSGNFSVSRHVDKMNQNGKMANYQAIYSDNSYKTHLSRAMNFSDWVKENHAEIKDFRAINKDLASEYLAYQKEYGGRNDGPASAHTLSADATMLNHVFVGTNLWDSPLRKSDIADMPKRSLDTIVNNRSLTSNEWLERHETLYVRNEQLIDTARAFGLRRSELIAGGRYDRALNTGSFFINEAGKLSVATVGKGGKYRLAEVTEEYAPKMRVYYAQYARPISELPEEKEFKENLGHYERFFSQNNHDIPIHIHRAYYAQTKFDEINRQYRGQNDVYKKITYDRNGQKVIRSVSGSEQIKIGTKEGSYGAFMQVSENLGHNRLDVLNNYLK